MENQENVLCSNYLGKITENRIILNGKNGKSEIPLKSISGISIKRNRNYTLSTIYVIVVVVIAYFLFVSSNLPGYVYFIGFIIIMFLILTAIAFYVGHHSITIEVNGKKHKPLKIKLSKTKEGLEFYNALRKVIV